MSDKDTKILDNENELKVVPYEEVKRDFEQFRSDVAELKQTWNDHEAATGLKLEERADDFQKALDQCDDLQKRFEELETKIAGNAYAASFGESAAELKDAIETFHDGFKEFRGDGAAALVEPGTKPSVKHLVEGVFTEAPTGDFNFHMPKHVAIDRMQKAYDDAYVVDLMLRSTMDSGQIREYEARGGIKSTKTFRRAQRLAENFTKAAADLIDTSTEVVNWIPTQYSSQLWEQVKIGLPLLNFFPEVSMSAPTMELPLDLNDHEAQRVVEITSATNANPYADTDFMHPSALSSNKVTLSAEKIRARYWISQEAVEDAIIAMLPFLNRKMRRGLGEALEDAFVNGDNAGGTGFDSAGTHYGKANPPAADDARYCWDGLRRFNDQYAGSPATKVDQSNADLDVTSLRGLRAAMGEYGIDPTQVAYILPMFGYVKLLDDTQLITLDKFGPQATVKTGVLGMVDGADVVVSRRIPQNANASGNIDNVTTNRTLALAVHRDSCVVGNRRRITMGETLHGSSDTRELYAFWRGDFQPVYPVATVPFVGKLYNVAAA